MTDYKLAELESRFVELVWQNEPIGSGELVKLSEKELNWKKPTTYTVLRRLCQKGILKNEASVVTSAVKRDEFDSGQSRQFVEEAFDGSLPKFVAAFSRSRKLSDKEVAELQRLIDEYRED